MYEDDVQSKNKMLYELHLVTIFHPEKLLHQIGHEYLLKVPHRDESRATRTSGQSKLMEAAGVKPQLRFNQGNPHYDGGKVAGGYCGVYLRGNILSPYLLEPRLIHINDEPPPKAKWKIEFRKTWSKPFGTLTLEQRQGLVAAIEGAVFKIKEIWINPPAPPGRINLVLVTLNNTQKDLFEGLSFKLISGVPFIELPPATGAGTTT